MRRSERGASVMEVLVTACLVMVLSATSMPLATSSLAIYRLRSDSHQLAAQLHNARFLAIAANTQHRLHWSGSTLQVQKLSGGSYSTVDTYTLASGVTVASGWASDPVINARGLVTPSVSVTLSSGSKSRTVSVSVVGLVTEQ